jgi:hypothetical protein
MSELVSPYPNADFDEKDVGQIIEEFLEENWPYQDLDENGENYAPGLTAEDIGWGVASTDMAQEKKEIAVMAFQIFSDIRDLALGGAMNGNFEMWWLDVWVTDVKTTTYRSPKLWKVLRTIKKILLKNKTGMQDQGLSSVNIYKMTPVREIEFQDKYHGIIGVEVRFTENLV